MSDDPFVSVVIIGAGGTGLAAALAVADAGLDVLVIERDPVPAGSTAMSTGLIPAAGTPEQRAAGIADDPERFLGDIIAKTKGATDLAVARRLVEESAETIAWLRDRHRVPLALVDGFLYPGHSAMRMYGTPNRSGAELMAGLTQAAEAADVPVLTNATVTDLNIHGDKIAGVTLVRPDGAEERVACAALILACSGFGGAPEAVARWIPEMADAVFYGHTGNKGDAVRWGQALGAELADMAAYQGHGGLAVGYSIPILWPLIMEGGIQVNRDGKRFSNEAAGYSEQAAYVNAQPGRYAFSIFDERLHRLMLKFDDYREAFRAGAILQADSVEALALQCRLPLDALQETLADVSEMVLGDKSDPFGRNFSGKPVLQPPFCAAKVTGALFHTQGGLVVDENARVVRKDGSLIANLFAGGGAARGISGPGASGYLAGNGLLTATSLGKIAGRSAATYVASLTTGPP